MTRDRVCVRRHVPALLLTVANVAMMSCRPSEGEAGARAEQPAMHNRVVDSAQPLLSLTRGPCFGRCPEYSVSLYSNGRVEYLGAAAVAVLGAASGRADSAAVWAVYDALLADGVAAADTVYGVDHPACRPYIADTPVLTLAVQLDGAVHRVQFEAGCAGVPGYLLRASEQIDRVAAADGWVRGLTPEERTP